MVTRIARESSRSSTTRILLVIVAPGLLREVCAGEYRCSGERGVLNERRGFAESIAVLFVREEV
jgi:hypothetical protein